MSRSSLLSAAGTRGEDTSEFEEDFVETTTKKTKRMARSLGRCERRSKDQDEIIETKKRDRRRSRTRRD